MNSSIPKATRTSSLLELGDLITFYTDIHECDNPKNVKTLNKMTCDHIALLLTAEKYINKHLL